MDSALRPIAKRLIGSAAATVDRAIVAALQMANRKLRQGPEALTHDERMERLAMIRYAIPDIRYLFENDPRFLAQF